MELTDLDRDSVLWEKLATHLTERIVLLRAKNDNRATDIETAWLRGQLQEAKAMLALGDEKPEFVSPGPRKS